jgi:hypothetical protein
MASMLLPICGIVNKSSSPLRAQIAWSSKRTRSKATEARRDNDYYLPPPRLLTGLCLGRAWSLSEPLEKPAKLLS